MRRVSPLAVAGFGVATGAGLIAYGLVLGASGALWTAAGLGLAGITLFATRAVPEVVAAFAIFLVALGLGTAPRDIIFSGFMSGGFWLIVSGIILGTAITATGLAARISGRLFALAGPSYGRATLVIATTGLLLGILVPSTMPRVIVMVPVAAAFAERLGLDPKGRGGIGLIATAVTATLLPTYTILTANLPTIVQIGAMQQSYGIASTYSEYMIQQWPVNALRFLLIAVLMMRFTTETPVCAGDDEAAVAPHRPEQRRLLIVLGVAILGWMTDFLHGIEPVWIAMAAAAIVIWPRFGMLDGNAMRERIDFSPPIFFAALVTVVAVAREAGLDQVLADAFIARLPLSPAGDLSSVYAVYGFSVIISHLTTAPAAPAVLVPFAAALSEATGLSLKAVSMVQMIGIATPVLAYQAPPLIVAMSISKVPNAVFVRLCVWLALAVSLVGLPLTYLWWQVIGFV